MAEAEACPLGVSWRRPARLPPGREWVEVFPRAGCTAAGGVAAPGPCLKGLQKAVALGPGTCRVVTTALAQSRGCTDSAVLFLAVHPDGRAVPGETQRALRVRCRRAPSNGEPWALLTPGECQRSMPLTAQQLTHQRGFPT